MKNNSCSDKKFISSDKPCRTLPNTISKLKIIPVTQITDIKDGDMIIIKGDVLNNEPMQVHGVKVSEKDGTEIIIDKRQNRFFNLGMYLEGKSWVKELYLIKSIT